ncbi:MAG: sensor histidine kinase [Bacteroidetes bacterium]|nr:MAG: sensor histidine kinase [Bacteroidota bacterium]
MKRLKRLYFIPVLISLLAAFLLIWKLAPAAFYSKALLIALIPLILLVIGFRYITYQRIQIIRNQLYQIFHALEEFDADEPTKVEFEDSPFPIFNELNEYLVELIDRIRTDFQAHKQFTQNASHELQTPLAIIKGHVEILLQSPNIGEKEVESLAIVLQNANRLSKINSALILLSKIEHQRFVDTEQVNFVAVADEVLGNFHDLIQIHNLEIRKEYSEIFEVNMSRTLAEILIANLVQNAIRHNVSEGFIEITIDSGSFSISNPGEILDIKPEALFKRFLRKSDAEESLGLGLSIVKRICEQSGLEVSYNHTKGQHSLHIHKNTN